VVAGGPEEATPEVMPQPGVTAPADLAADARVSDERLTRNVLLAVEPPGEAPAQLPALPMPGVETSAGPAVESTAATVADAPVAAATIAAPVAGTFDDPFAYCSAVKTIDYIDNRYTGPRFTAAIAEALRVPLQSAPDRVSWRCVDGVIYACASFDWPACAMTPTAQEMVEYCQRNPGSTRLLAPNGTWSCEGNRPRLPDGASWPVDARGFFPNAWIPVLPPQGPAG
jgi:hypothetical protein